MGRSDVPNAAFARFRARNSVESISAGADHGASCFDEGVTTVVTDTPPRANPPAADASPRRRAALRLALRLYARELRRHPLLAAGALLLPALGAICVRYLPPLAVAELVARVVDGQALTVPVVGPYVGAFAAAMLVGELCWRLGIHCLNRVDAYGMEQLHVDGMDGQIAAMLAGGRPGDPGFGEEPPERYGTLTTDLGGLASTGRLASVPGDYPAFYREMAAAVRGEGPVPVPAEQAREVVRVIERATESSRDGRVVPYP